MDNSPAVVEVSIAPGRDGSVQMMITQVEGIKKWADKRIVSTLADVKSATDDLTIISNLKKALEEKRKEYVSPLNEHVKAINATFKRISQPLDDADKTTRGKILAYRKEQEDIRHKLEEAARLQAEALAQQAKAGQPVTEVAAIIPAPPPVPDKIFRDTGSLGVTMVRKWEVVNFAEVPDDYKIVDAAKVGKVVRAGIPSITGIRIWEEESLRVTPTKVRVGDMIVDTETGEIGP